MTIVRKGPPARVAFFCIKVTNSVDPKTVTLQIVTMNGSKSPIALLMGDIVKSEKNAAPDILYNQFNTVIDKVNKDDENNITSPLTITLGDEFQGFFKSLLSALTAARRLRMLLMTQNVQCRFVIGYAFLDTPLNTQNAWNMMGRGLGRAREKLEQKTQGVNYAFSLPDDPTTELLFDAIGIGVSVIERGWTKTQFEIIRDLNNGNTAKTIARDRGVSVHNIYKIRTAGEYDAYTTQWQKMSAALTKIGPEAIR